MPDNVDPEATRPPEEADGSGVTRRKFVTRTALGAAGACYAAALGYPIYRYLATPAKQFAEMAAITEVPIPADKVPPPGSALMFKFGVKPAMLIHHTDGSMVCFSAVCTHLGCTVQYQPDQDHIHCACHGGTYDSRTGGNVSGPPPKPLAPYKVETVNGQIVVRRV